MEIMIDNTSFYEKFFFMDGFSRYNQIKIDLDGEKHTAFRTLIGMLLQGYAFWAEECRATYQRAYTKIFND